MSDDALEYHSRVGDPAARAELAALVNGENGRLTLDEGALLIAMDERPGARVAAAATRATLDQMADRVHLRPGIGLPEAVARLSIHLFGADGLRGDRKSYDDPRNSDLPLVLERSCGLPILLSIVMVAVARRLGLPLVGVGFPGHFLVGVDPAARADAGLPEDRSFWVDPFHGGRVLGREELRASLTRNFPQAPTPTDKDWQRLTGPADPVSVLVRINQNLKRSWAKRNDINGALRAIERTLLLTPDAWIQHRDRGLLLARIGAKTSAVESLETYLAHESSASDAPRIAMILSTLRMS